MRAMLASVLVGSAGLWGPASLGGEPPSPGAVAPRSRAASGPNEPASPIQITLQAKRASAIPGTHGDGLADGGKITVETPEPAKLKASMSGLAAAHCFLGCHSSALQSLRLVQEFAITSTDPDITQVKVSLQSSLQGYVRSHHQGAAWLRVASVTVTSSDTASSALSACFQPACVSGPGGQRLYQQEFQSPAGQFLPLGRYALVADLVLEAAADGVVDGRGVADFSAADLPDAWKQEHDPFKDQDRKNFGLTITVTAKAAHKESAASDAQK